MDPAAAALAFILQVLGLPADPAELLHQSGKSALSGNDMLRIARRFPVKARIIATTLERLESTPMPVLARMTDAARLVVGRVKGGRILLQDPQSPTATSMTVDEFAERWERSILLIARRAALGDPFGSFGVSWFIDAIKKYQQPLGEVLVSSFFVQLFALLTPLFFQVIIDKVFVHRGMSTLEVLALGLAILSVFEVVLGGLRTYATRRPRPPSPRRWRASLPTRGRPRSRRP
jgi:subfamily B ATP-binding cassette protein HlyB/CyaB